MLRLRHVFMIASFALIGCASAAAADTAGFKDVFKYISTRHWYLSNGWANGPHMACEWRANALKESDGGLKMTVSDRGGTVRPIGCAEMHTTERLSYGLFESRIKTAAGSGLNTAFYTYIGPTNGVKEHDEIDFEFLGKKPNTVNLTVWVNGKAQDAKVVDLGFDASQDFHDYAFDWQPDKVVWYVDGKEVFRNTPTKPQPHNAGLLFLSLWAGAEMENAWMGPFTYKDPVTATVAWTAYTPPDAACQFPESLKCKKP